MSSTYKLNVNLSPEHFQAIGQVAAYWSLLEFFVGRAIGQILGVGLKQGRVLTTQMNIAPQLETLQLLAELAKWPQPELDDLKNVIGRIKDAQALRRAVIHGVWAKDDNDKFVILKYWGRKGRGRILADVVPADVQDIQKIANEIAVVTETFNVWWESRRAWLAPSPDKSG